jgi:hypothetical protein
MVFEVRATGERAGRAGGFPAVPAAGHRPPHGRLASLTTYLRFPGGHLARVRHPKFIEQTFGDTRRPMIGRLPGERTCQGLAWAVVDRASRGWRGVVMTPTASTEAATAARELIHEEPALVPMCTAFGTPPVPPLSAARRICGQRLGRRGQLRGVGFVRRR